jgi:hypothetical protein
MSVQERLITTSGQPVTLDEFNPRPTTLSVVVPAVAADAVGYVNKSTVGTGLEGILVGETIVANPTSDLVAAGAGGGFINAWVVGTSSIRFSFSGALAGGAANFLVKRV